MLIHAIAGAAMVLVMQDVQQRRVLRPLAPEPFEIELRISDASGRGATLSGGNAAAGFAGVAWVDGSCVPSVGPAGGPAVSKEAAKTPEFGWSFSATLVNTPIDSAQMRIRWQRAWEHSAARPDQSKPIDVITLRAGDRIELDRLKADETGPCAGAGLKLEAVLTRQTSRPSLLRSLSFSKNAKLSNGRTITAMPLKPLRFDTLTRTIGLFDMELWLVHIAPDGKEEVIRQAQRFQPAGSSFIFPGVTITTPAGNFVVTVNGTLNDVTETDGPKMLSLVMTRRVVGPSPARKATVGATHKLIPWPEPADVISIELPPTATPAPEALEGHRFSLRLRVSKG